MQNWFGSAAVCINENGELLMVLQGNPMRRKSGLSLQVEKKREKDLKHAVLERLRMKLDT